MATSQTRSLKQSGGGSDPGGLNVYKALPEDVLNRRLSQDPTIYHYYATEVEPQVVFLLAGAIAARGMRGAVPKTAINTVGALDDASRAAFRAADNVGD